MIELDAHESPRRSLSLDHLVDVFRKCLLALVPYMSEVGIKCDDAEAYDDWDRIEESLFESIVMTPINFTFEEGQHRSIPRYDIGYEDSSKYSVLFDEALGPKMRFFCLENGGSAFDTVRFVPTANTGTDRSGSVQKALKDVRFAVRLIPSASGVPSTSRTVNID